MLDLLDGVLLEGLNHSETVWMERAAACLSEEELHVQVVELRHSAGRGMNQAPLSLPVPVLKPSSIC